MGRERRGEQTTDVGVTRKLINMGLFCFEILLVYI